MGIIESMKRAREHFHNWRDPVPTRRYTMSQLDYTGFPSSEDREVFIKHQLKVRGFDLTKPIEQFRGVNNDRVLFEQIDVTGGETL